ncbi:hypothetical protein [Halohasta litorea]|uniref:Concanavalin A-like lectin/glucanases superfamily protein n=1 Tax=Halohasta litorea TaxID=869891 RepID=A0ABD6DDI4_9EURY|nr:hypothetical protein [Halohasta litorea]
MTDGSSRFTSDRRLRGDTSWESESDWAAGIAENVDVVDGGLVARDQLVESGELPSNVVDDFESGSLSEYGYIDSPLEVTQARAFDGSWSLRDDHPERTSEVFAVSTSGLDDYPKAGDVISYRNYIESSSAGDPVSQFYFAAQSESAYPDGYCVNLDRNNNGVELLRDGFVLDSVGIRPPADEWLRVQIIWGQNGQIDVVVEGSGGSEIASLSALDPTYVAGGIGFACNYYGAGSGSGIDEEVYWDEILTT